MTHAITVVPELDIRQVVGMDAEMFAAVEKAFVWTAEGRAQSPPFMHVAIPEHHGDVDVKSAYIDGEAYFAVKVAAWFSDNLKLGLPTGSGLVILLDSRTGRPDTVFLDNGYLTDVRTAAAGAIAVKLLAHPESCRLGIVGAGVQARYQARAIAASRPLLEMYVTSRSEERASRYADEMALELGLPVRTTSVDGLMSCSDIIVTTTAATDPVLFGAGLKAGQTVIAMGSDAPHKRELDASAFMRAARIVCDNRRQCEFAGELHHAIDAGVLRSDMPVIELGDVASGRKRGRLRDDEIVICDLTGMGAQDTAIGLYARRKVRERKLGLLVPGAPAESAAGAQVARD